MEEAPGGLSGGFSGVTVSGENNASSLMSPSDGWPCSVALMRPEGRELLGDLGDVGGLVLGGS